MEKERSIDRLARYVMMTAGAAVILAICWFFRDVIIYILAASIVALIGKPLMNFFLSLRIKGKGLPAWLYAALTIIIILGSFVLIVTMLVPIITGIAKDVSMANVESAAMSVAASLKSLNEFLMNTFPNLGSDFRIEREVVKNLKEIINVSEFSALIGSAASFIANFGVGLFAVVFISFFFLKDGNLFENILAALVPDRHELNVRAAYNDIMHLLSRYFIGLIVEMAGVALIDFLGLMFIARLGFNASIGIAVICGVMNIIPYLGPWLGGAIGSVLAITIRYFCMGGTGLDVGFWVFVLILVGIFCAAQLIDNYIFQPIVYSSSIKANVLEIFIVLMMAGHIGGILGMLVAIPCYTVLRVIAGRFFGHVKFVRKLIGGTDGRADGRADEGADEGADEAKPDKTADK